MPRMLVVRGNRESCLAFYNQFKRFDIDYVAASSEGFSQAVGKLAENVGLKNLKFVPAVVFDPVTLLTGRASNLSWTNIEGIEELVAKCDVVNLTDTYYFFNAQVARLAKKYHKPVVTVIWTMIPNHPSVWLPPYSFNVAEVLRQTHLFILRSRAAYVFTDGLGIDRKKTVMIYKGVDLEHFYPRKMKKKLAPVRILYVGNYHQSKGVSDLLIAFERLVNEGLPVQLVMAGRGNLDSLVREKAKILPIENHGFVNYHDLGKLYRSADIFCSPSKELRWWGIKIWEEYFSYTLMEAQASGLPIVATRSGGIVEEVGEKNILVAPGNIEGLTDGLRQLVAEPRKREEMGKNNRARAVRFFDAKVQAEKTEEAIMKLLDSATGVN